MRRNVEAVVADKRYCGRNKMIKMKFMMWGVIVLVVLAGLFFVFSGEEEIIEFTGEVREFDIVAKQFSFEPEIIEVNEGDLVRIKIKSIDVVHSISIPDFRINERLLPGKEVEFEFVADKVGEFNFFCMVYCGEKHNEMDGKLIVK